MAGSAQFTVGKEYRRSDLHDQYGGSRQSGISPSKTNQIILLFTGDSGKQYGYLNDGFRDNGTYWYTGEGRNGDMRMARGNLAIRDSLVDEKQLHLFEQNRKGFVQYRGEFAYLDHHEGSAPDFTGVQRKVFIFELEVVSGELEFTPSFVFPSAKPELAKLWNLPLNQLRDLASAISSRQQTPVERKRIVYQRSEAVRIYALRRADGKCEGCEQKAPFKNDKGQPYLEPHHVARVADEGPDHPAWVAALCPNCHRRVHVGYDRKSYNELIAEKIRLIERDWASL
jgi:5-methylcytosine-specific restriction protein A